MTDSLLVRASFFPTVWATEPVSSLSLADYLDGVRSGRWAAEVETARAALSRGDERGYTLAKRKLGAVTVSCEMASRAVGAAVRVVRHTGWLQVDFDLKDNPQITRAELPALRLALAADPHVGAVFQGPSGRGAKVIVRIDGTRHRESALSAGPYFMTKYGLRADPSCKDVERLCFVSHDPEAWVRDDEAVALPITDVREADVRSFDARGQVEQWVAEDVRELLQFVPARPDYDTWLRVCSGVFSVLPMAEACEVLNEWSPEETAGEYAGKHRARLREVTIRSVIKIAQSHGFDASAAAKRKRWLGRIVWADGTNIGHGDLLREDVGGALALDPVETWTCLEREQMGDAELFRQLRGPDFRFDLAKQLWRHYDAGRGLWMLDRAGTTALDFGESVADEYGKLADTVGEELRKAKADRKDVRWKEVELLTKRAKQLRSEAYRNGSLTMAQRMRELTSTAAEYDSRRHLLGLAGGGVLDLDAAMWRPAERGDMLSVCAPVQFDPAAKCPQFDEFLVTIFDGDSELIAFWWRVVGYCLTGYVDQDALFFFYGSGANGKSTALMALRMLFGDDLSAMISIDTLLGAENGMAAATADYKKSMLEGRRVVFTDEIPEHKRFSESTIKQVVSGEDIVARRPFEKPYAFAPTHKVICIGNHKPKITGTDHGIWRRIHLVPFTVTIPEGKRRPRHEMLAEFRKVLPGMLNRAIAGWLDLRQRGGLHPPQAVAAATDEYRNEEDQVGQFLDEATEKETTATVTTRSLFRCYLKWCEDQNEFPVAKTAKGFVLKLKGHGETVVFGHARVTLLCGRRLIGDSGPGRDDLL